MIGYPRIDPPRGFADRVRPHAEAIRAIVDAGGQPASKDFTGVWREYKPRLRDAQHRKCGYCEMHLSDQGDVEHFAPKAQVHVRAADGRTLQFTPGYWWLAYRWDNYLVACSTCNTSHKRNLFPTEPPLTGPPDERAPPDPLLLDPFGPIDPADHLAFDRLGGVSARDGSPRGRATIETLRLDRARLYERRAQRAADVDIILKSHLHQLEADWSRGRSLLPMARKIVDLGADRHCHAAVVRPLIVEALSDYLPGKTWPQLKAAFGR